MRDSNEVISEATNQKSRLKKTCENTSLGELPMQLEYLSFRLSLCYTVVYCVVWRKFVRQFVYDHPSQTGQ